MKNTLPMFLLLCCLLAAAGCTGTEETVPEHAGTLAEAREVFGPDIPEPSYLPKATPSETPSAPPTAASRLPTPAPPATSG